MPYKYTTFKIVLNHGKHPSSKPKNLTEILKKKLKIVVTETESNSNHVLPCWQIAGGGRRRKDRKEEEGGGKRARRACVRGFLLQFANSWVSWNSSNIWALFVVKAMVDTGSVYDSASYFCTTYIKPVTSFPTQRRSTTELPVHTIQTLACASS